MKSDNNKFDTNYYKFIFDGQQEYIVVHDSDDINAVIDSISGSLLNSKEYLILQYQLSEPVYIKKDRLFSVQKLLPVTIGNQARLWRLK